MTAIIIQFPCKPALQRISSEGFPIHWTGWDQHSYERLQRCDGLSPKEAWARVGQEIADKRAADALPPGKDRLLFLARLAMSRLPRR